MILFEDPSFTSIVLIALCIPLLVVAVFALVASVSRHIPRWDSSRGDKRRGPRSKTDIVCDLDDGKGGFTPGNARVLDISAWGARITCNLPLQQGQLVRGRIRSAVDHSLQIIGRVVWIKPSSDGNLYGITFDQISRV